MTVQVTLFAAAVIWGLNFVSSGGSLSIEPSIGDVRLWDYDGTVAIYFTDGIHQPQWGTICAKKSLPNTAKVVCRQLGHSSGHKSLTRPPSLPPGVIQNGSTSLPSRMWLTDVDCGEEDTSFSHILQCTYTVIVADDTRNMCQNDDLLRISCDPETSAAYSGQVRLCPPDGFLLNGNQSISFGLVQIYLYGGWGGINEHNASHVLGSHTADSICRQLGYTNAVAGNTMTQESATASLSSETNSIVSFSNCYHRTDTIKQAWFTTEQVKCGHSEDCFGCCFSFPLKSNLCSDCDVSKDVVIRCTFDHTITHGIYWRDCSFASEASFKSLKDSACSQQEISLRTFEIVVGTVGSVALLLFITLSTIAIGYCSCRLYHRVRPPQGQQQRHQLLAQQDDEN